MSLENKIESRNTCKWLQNEDKELPISQKTCKLKKIKLPLQYDQKSKRIMRRLRSQDNNIRHESSLKLTRKNNLKFKKRPQPSLLIDINEKTKIQNLRKKLLFLENLHKIEP